MKSMKPIKQLKLSVPAQETPITSFLTTSGTFQDGDLLLNQNGLRLIYEEDDSLPSDAKEIDLQFSPEDLEIIKFISKGSGGMVQLVRHKWVGTLFALKQKVLLRVTMIDSKKSRAKAMKIAATVSGVESVAIKGDNKDQIEVIGEGIDTVIQMNIQEEFRKQIVQELQINQASQCSHVVVFYHSFYHNEVISLVFEYMDRDSLTDVIRQVKTILKPYLAVVCKQVLQGLVYLHNERHVIHRDIKPSNLLVNRKGEVKITDLVRVQW